MFSYMISISLIIFLAFLSSCNEFTKVKIVGATGTSSTNSTTPTAPSALSIQSPYSPSTSATPTIRVSGVSSGDTVEIFSNSSCTTSLGSGSAAGSTIDIVTSSLAVGTYTIYAKATNSGGLSSTCSTVFVSYERYQCPTNFISVPFNTAVGTSTDFCVAKYEMKDVGSVATSQMALTPWVSLDRPSASTACTNLGAKYFLITNPEWMTISRNIEAVNTNWSSGTSGTGTLNWGHSDGVPGGPQDASTDNDGYFGTGNSIVDPAGAGREQTRIHTLSNGEVIWDFSGNVWEWVNWDITPAEKAYLVADGSPQGAFRDFKDLNAKIGPTDEMKPSTWQPLFATLDAANNGLGGYYAGNNASGGAAMRGGAAFESFNSGIYALAIDSPASLTDVLVGFRCVYRP